MLYISDIHHIINSRHHFPDVYTLSREFVCFTVIQFVRSIQITQVDRSIDSMMVLTNIHRGEEPVQDQGNKKEIPCFSNYIWLFLWYVWYHSIIILFFLSPHYFLCHFFLPNMQLSPLPSFSLSSCFLCLHFPLPFLCFFLLFYVIFLFIFC